MVRVRTGRGRGMGGRRRRVKREGQEENGKERGGNFFFFFLSLRGEIKFDANSSPRDTIYFYLQIWLQYHLLRRKRKKYKKTKQKKNFNKNKKS